MLLPTITTVIPTYINSQFPHWLLIRSLRSVVAQSYQPVQLIISDNSPDLAGLQIARIILSKSNLSDVLYLDSRSYMGISENSNFGKKHAKGDVVHVLHQDDSVLNQDTYLSVAMTFMKEDSFDWLVCGRKIGNEFLQPWIDPNFLLGYNSLGGPSCLFARREKYCDYRSDLKFFLDVFLYHQLFDTAGNTYLLKNEYIETNMEFNRVSNTIADDAVVQDLLILVNDGFIDENIIDWKLFLKHRNLPDVSRKLLQMKHRRLESLEKGWESRWDYVSLFLAMVLIVKSKRLRRILHILKKIF